MRNLRAGLLICSTLMCSASAEPQSASSFTQEELQIYRMLLQNYPQKIGDLLGLKSATDPFPARTPMLNMEGRPILLRMPSHHARFLPKDITSLVKQDEVVEKIKAQGEYVPRSRRSSWTRPDGLVQTRLALSDIAFSVDGQWAAMAFNADCGCKGGEGGIAVFHRSEVGWHLTGVVESWIG